MKEGLLILDPASEARYVNQRAREARAQLQEHFPYLVPREPTRTRIGPLPWKRTEAMFAGKLRGKHRVFVNNVVRESQQQARRVFLRSTMVHELAHQWHAETMGPETWHAFDREGEFTSWELERDPSDRVARKYDGSYQGKGALTDTITEGIALFVEEEVCKRTLKEAHREGNPQEVADLELLMEKGIRRIIYPKTPNFCSDGYQLITVLQDEFGLPGLFQVVAGWDYEYCNTIEVGTSVHQRMLDNPLLIPMREGVVRRAPRIPTHTVRK